MMKKIFAFGMLALSMSFLLLSCSKDEEEELKPYTGFYVGLSGLGSEVPTNDFAILFRSDGSMRYYESSDTTKGTKQEGTYTVIDKALEFRLNSSTYVGSGTYNADFTILEGGSWFYDVEASGTFNLVKR